MDEDPQHKALTDFEARLRQAKESAAPTKTVQNPKSQQKASRIGFDFMAAVLGGAFLGWLMDRGLGTKPWGIMGMLLLGFAAGILNVWRALSAPKSED